MQLRARYEKLMYYNEPVTISNNLPENTTTLFMKHACYTMSALLDHAIKEKYNSMKINDPLIFVKNAIDLDAFTPLLNDLYHNDTDNGGRPNIPVKILYVYWIIQ